MKFGLALSGGGYRATVFHLGMLARLAHSEQLENVKYISTVSGGSISIGLVFAANSYQWPTSSTYLLHVLPTIRHWLITSNLQRQLALKALLYPLTLFQPKAIELSRLLQKNFGLEATIQELPDEPRWIINTACYESGALFRIEKRRMGDYKVGSVFKPELPISDAVAASAGFPIGIGPLRLDTKNYQWSLFEEGVGWKGVESDFKKLHLWDGGVYDNLGTEALFDPDKGLRMGDFLIVSDASGLFTTSVYGWGIKPMKRLIDIATYQVRALRSRAVVEYFKRTPDKGVYLQSDNNCRHILKDSELNEDKEVLCANCLSAEDVILASNMKTHIRTLRLEEFELLFRHGYEVANATLYRWHNNQFDWLNYSPN